MFPTHKKNPKKPKKTENSFVITEWLRITLKSVLFKL